MFAGIEGDAFGWWNGKCMMYFDVEVISKLLLVLTRLRSAQHNSVGLSVHFLYIDIFSYCFQSLKLTINADYQCCWTLNVQIPNHSSHTVLFQEVNVSKSTNVTNSQKFESYNGDVWKVIVEYSMYVHYSSWRPSKLKNGIQLCVWFTPFCFYLFVLSPVMLLVNYEEIRFVKNFNSQGTTSAL